MAKRNECIVITADAVQAKMMDYVQEFRKNSAVPASQAPDNTGQEKEDESQTQTFKASFGWLRRILKRHNLVNRRISVSGKDFEINAKN